MLSKDKLLNLYIGILSAFALAAIIWAIRGITAEHIDAVVVTLALLSVFCSCYLPIRVARLKRDVAVSDGLIILSLLMYGGEIAVVMAVLVTVVTLFLVSRRTGQFSPAAIL